ncbi:MAG: DUF4837 family protein [Candidatus Cloacimonetes bacterium]|nr:DUF4837 family protein [Candidatus Cloacimonadota bacterium]
MRKNLLILLVISFMIGCSDNDQKYRSGSKKVDPRKPMSWGHPQTIYVFADDHIWNKVKPDIEANLGRFYFTTENETYFEIKHAPVNSIEQFFKFNNLLFLTDLSSNGEVSKYVNEIMNEKVKTEISQNSIGMYPKENLWANDQYLLFILADDQQNLVRFNELQANKTFELFKEKLFQRIAGQSYKQKIYSPAFFEKFPWDLKLTKNYIVYEEAPDFISFLARLRNHPDRYISVYSEKISEELFGKKWLLEKRGEIAWKHFDEDEFSDQDIKTEKSKLGRYDCLKLSGRWQNKKHAVGGCFQSFAVYDKTSGTAFIIDNSIYFPEGFKLAGLIEMEVISRTFKIK